MLQNGKTPAFKEFRCIFKISTSAPAGGVREKLCRLTDTIEFQISLILFVREGRIEYFRMLSRARDGCKWNSRRLPNIPVTWPHLHRFRPGRFRRPPFCETINFNLAPETVLIPRKVALVWDFAVSFSPFFVPFVRERLSRRSVLTTEMCNLFRVPETAAFVISIQVFC